MKDDTAERQIPPASEVFEDEGLRQAAFRAEAGDVAGLRGLNIDLDAIAPGNVNLLMYYLTAQNEVAVKALLDAGANPNVLTPSGTSPMLMGAVQKDSKWLGLLLDHGGDPKLENAQKEPLITSLAYFEVWDNILLLLDRGANINAAGPSRKTLMHIFGGLHQFDRVHVLLERGADPTILTAKGVELQTFVKQPITPNSPQLEWRKKVAAKLGVELP